MLSSGAQACEHPPAPNGSIDRLADATPALKRSSSLVSRFRTPQLFRFFRSAKSRSATPRPMSTNGGLASISDAEEPVVPAHAAGSAHAEAATMPRFQDAPPAAHSGTPSPEPAPRPLLATPPPQARPVPQMINEPRILPYPSPPTPSSMSHSQPSRHLVYPPARIPPPSSKHALFGHDLVRHAAANSACSMPGGSIKPMAANHHPTHSSGLPSKPLVQPPPPPSNVTVAQKMLEKHKLVREFEENYLVGDELGSGGFGFVVTALRRCDNVEVAVKFIFKDKVPVHSLCKDEELGVIPMEVYILKNVKHENIVGFIDFFKDNKFYYLIMELHGVPWTKKGDMPPAPSLQGQQQPTPPSAKAPGSAAAALLHPPPLQRSYSEPYPRPPSIGRRHSMDLFECIEANQRLSEETARCIFQQMVSAVQYLASKNMIHRDIKDENIVVDQNYRVKLIDFGSASTLPPNGRLFDRFAGTLQYCPPEVLQGEKYRGPEQEIWALGILLYTILFSGAPFANMTQVIHHEMPIPRHTRGPNTGAPKASPEVIHLLQWMLQKRPLNRATIQQVASHPWVTKKAQHKDAAAAAMVSASASAPGAPRTSTAPQAALRVASAHHAHPAPLPQRPPYPHPAPHLAPPSLLRHASSPGLSAPMPMRPKSVHPLHQEVHLSRPSSPLVKVVSVELEAPEKHLSPSTQQHPDLATAHDAATAGPSV